MQINFKSFIANLLGERLLHKACDRLKTRVLWLWYASWCDTGLCFLSCSWQLSRRFRAVQGPDPEELWAAASPRQGTPILQEKSQAWLMTVEQSGTEEGRGMDWGAIKEPPEPPDMWGWPLGSLVWLQDSEVEPLSCSPEDLTGGTERKQLLWNRVEFSSGKACSIMSLCYLGFRNYPLQILGWDREDQGHAKIIFASSMCSLWWAGLATLPLISVWQGEKCSHSDAKLRNWLEESSAAVKAAPTLPCAFPSPYPASS